MEKILEFLKSLTEKRKSIALRTEYGKYTSRDRVVEYSDKEKEYLVYSVDSSKRLKT